HTRHPGVWGRRKTRGPPSTGGSTSKSSSHTPRSRRWAGRRVVNRSMGSRRCPSADTTKSFPVIVGNLYQPVGTCNAGGGPRGDAMTKRWTRRPPGSTWGDWGDDDELGRVNLLTPEKVLPGVRGAEAGRGSCRGLP